MSSSTVLIIAFLCLAIGYLAGILVASLSANRKPAEEIPEPISPKQTVEPLPMQAAPQEITAPVVMAASAVPVTPAAISPEPIRKPPPPPQESIVQQIDAILQSQIDGSDLFNRGVRLAETPGQGVTVWIGIKPYHGIEAVDDPEVLKAIQKAVKTWEAQTH